MARRRVVPDTEFRGVVAATMKAARAKSGRSQGCVAAGAGVNRTYVAKIEKASVVPNLRSLLQLARGLGIPAWKIVRHIERRMAPETPAGGEQ